MTDSGDFTLLDLYRRCWYSPSKQIRVELEDEDTATKLGAEILQSKYHRFITVRIYGRVAVLKFRKTITR